MAQKGLEFEVFVHYITYGNGIGEKITLELCRL